MMNKDNNSDYILLLLFYEKCYSLYFEKTVDDENQQADACCVWRQNYCRQHFCPPILLQMSTGSTTPNIGATWRTGVYVRICMEENSLKDGLTV